MATSKVSREPAAIGLGVIGLLGALLPALALFGVNISIEQQDALMAVFQAALPLVGALLAIPVVRSKVTPVATLGEGLEYDEESAELDESGEDYEDAQREYDLVENEVGYDEYVHDEPIDGEPAR